MGMYLAVIIIVGCIISVCMCKNANLNDALEFLDRHNNESEIVWNRYVKAEWAFNTNITDHNGKLAVAESVAMSNFAKQAAEEADGYAWHAHDEEIQRQFKKILDIGPSAMEDDAKLQRMNEIRAEMESIYSTAEVCITGGCYPLSPDLTEMMASTRDYDKLTEIWKGWRDETGKKMKTLYKNFTELSNEGVKNSGHGAHKDTGDYWRSWYESDTFEADVEALYNQLRPLYEQLHSYVRRHLIELYGAERFPSEGHIPAHLLGNMWAQQWNNLLDILQPYKDKESVDVTPNMVEQGYDAIKMFEVSDEFFESLGMIPMPDTFWNNSMLTKPDDGRDVICHASAWDFYDRKDFRVKQCTVVTMEDLVTVHHEMGHIEYYLQYAHQPTYYRRGANPGFHEAIGDVMSLSVSTPKHLQKIGLLSEVMDDQESTINYMMSMALEKIAFLPFGYLMDQWRWSVFNGSTPIDQYTTKWWELRCKYQGIFPPVVRSEEDFDPGAKFHIPSNTPYIRYFVSFIIQFQFHKALCQVANQTGPLHECDIYQSKEAGALLSDILKLGSSRKWPEVMEIITGQGKMDAQPLLDYFQPLLDWLKEANAGHEIGWQSKCPPIPQLHSSSQTVHCEVLPFFILALLLVFR